MSRTVILGAGLTGLVAAERLSRTRSPFRIFEREQQPGGACRTVELDGFTFDLTGHLLHVGRSESEAYLKELGVWESLEIHDRRAGIRVGDRITPYPIQIHTHGLDRRTRRDCLLGFIKAWAEGPEDEPRSFREWVLQRFGEGLAEHFFFPYNRKLYRAEPEELSLDWVGRYVPKPNLEEVVDGALGLHSASVGYNAVFRYPSEGGIECLPKSVAERVDGLELGQTVCAVNLEEKWVELEDGECVDFDHLVSTISLPSMLDLIVHALPNEVAEARSALRWVRVVNLALGMQGPAPRPEHWLYFPDPELPFYRVGFPSNHGRVAPEGTHTVSVEVSFDPGSGDVDEAAERSLDALVKIGLVDPASVMVRNIVVLDPAYVVFDHHRRGAVARIRRCLSRHGVLLAGRWAEWKYSAMEDAILDGMTVARRLSRQSGAARVG